MNKLRFLIAGGGTGGHLFPVIATAEEILKLRPEADILFVGSRKKIEGTVVPKLGFKFKSIWVSGFARKLNFSNIIFPIKLIISLIQSLFISAKFKPIVAIGGGGFVSGPAIWAAKALGAKVALIEQNNYPGVTTRLLEKKAEEIHLAYEESRKYFRCQSKLKITGNPVRGSLKIIKKSEALNYFKLDADKKTLFVFGGSLGAGSINNAVAKHIEVLKENKVQIIWQTGKYYYETFKRLECESICVESFIEDMSVAYSAADLTLSRAGASAIAELSNLGAAAIFVPSPNVAANHQYYNAKALSDKGAAILIKDEELSERLAPTVLKTIIDAEKLSNLRIKIKQFAKPNAARDIAEAAIKLAERV